MRKTGILGAVASMLAISSNSADIAHHMGRTRYRAGYAKGGWCAFNPKRNRWTGHPHEHKREIARRARQAERKAAKGAR